MVIIIVDKIITSGQILVLEVSKEGAEGVQNAQKGRRSPKGLPALHRSQKEQAQIERPQQFMRSSLLSKAHGITVGSTQYGGIYTQFSVTAVLTLTCHYYESEVSEICNIFLWRRKITLFLYIFISHGFILDLIEYLLQYLIIFISEVILCILQFPMFQISNLFSCCGFFHAFYNWHLQMFCTMRPTG